MCENVHLDRVVDASRPVRDPYWDIMKGLGIIAVAAGHAMVLPIEVNYYHIALFFFVGGALFKSEKCRDYGHFFMKKFKGLWWPFFLYNAFFFCLQPFFLWIRFLLRQPAIRQLNWLKNMAMPVR